ncbi:DUF1153 domain-containing protein [Tistrella mobilis]|jgi:hypothetical protein|uniref:DUF1153 domain-containing protein n=1 Tax=Tistrella mobilis TaxID=171437 RepID=UPI003557BDB8
MTTPRLKLVSPAPDIPDTADGNVVALPEKPTRPKRSAALRFDLPPGNGVRWVARRKIEVVAAVMAGAAALDDVCRRYALSLEEFESWRQAHGADASRLIASRSRRGRKG